MNSAQDTALAGLIDAVRTDPLDAVSWLVLADRLEELDDPRANRCRFMIRCRKLASMLGVLRHEDNVNVTRQTTASTRLITEKLGKDYVRLWGCLCIRYMPRDPYGMKIWDLLAHPIFRFTVDATERDWTGIVVDGEMKMWGESARVELRKFGEIVHPDYEDYRRKTNAYQATIRVADAFVPTLFIVNCIWTCDVSFRNRAILWASTLAEMMVKDDCDIPGWVYPY